ncbi:hypothetical protein C7C46_17995 [Streptomyces tateyamensis]|uniref:DUF397 domain-containing protein n=1 Tax=Streptomyces tateyamensis TaxID=565073 RepID=A0A2V4N1H4_9ACTN|nr:DUF397 domain-containing protein [Streptomyces tateyamensis]PYC77745.1 hypothetical protein C7C46_17995 [Streptomyces tateyamensis]
MQQLNWVKPAICEEGNSCPEVAITEDSVYVRSTLHPGVPATQLTHQEWRDLMDGISKGEFAV